MTLDANLQDYPASAFVEAPPDDDQLNSENFRHLAKALPEIVWTSNPDGSVDFLNAQWGNFSGLAEDDPDYLDWVPLVHPDDLEGVQERWELSLATGEGYEHEFRLRSANGDYAWFFARAIPVVNDSKEIVKWYGVTTNIDQNKKMQFRLRAIAEQKDTFIAMLGHELRNPLAAISTSYALLNREDAHEKQRELAFRLLGQQIRHLTRLVDDTLDVSRLSSGKLRLIRTPLQLNDLVRDCCEGQRGKALKNEIDLAILPNNSEIWIDGDEVRLTQCLANVLDNAVKFTSPGGTIKVFTELKAGSAYIRVADTGVGMTPEELCRIFEPFEQGLGAQQFSTAGLGLGLAVIDKLITLHGGKVSATSEGKGLGTTFSISLPPIPPPAKVEKVTDTSQMLVGPRQILILEDNESVAQTLQMFFELEDHQVRVANTCDAAFEMFAERIPDLFISDLTLPGELSGWDVATMICENHPPDRRPYLVALSGHTQPSDRERSKEAGFDTHLSKPPTPDQLRAVVQEAHRAMLSRSAG